MSESLSLEILAGAVAGQAAAFRSTTTLQPVGGPGDKLFPVTYAGGVYAGERRVAEPGKEPIECILLDSVQSQANRAEEALKHAIDRGELSLPLIEVDFSKANGSFRVDIPTLTSLDVPHRLADAILRDSQLPNGTRFSKSDYAKRWARSTAWDATAIYELCPTALVFGLWGSPEKPGGLGAKFERAYVSEVVAVDAQVIDGRQGFRVDPINANKDAKLNQKADGSFEVTDKGKLRPSEINHSNIPFNATMGGIRCRYAEQTTVVSLGALRKLHFPHDGKQSPARNDAARTVLAALALCAGVLATERGLSLRSRCQLWPEQARQWELLDIPGETPRQFTLNGQACVALLKQAVTAAEKAGLKWDTQPVRLVPTPELAELVRKSQELQAKEKGEGEAAGASA